MDRGKNVVYYNVNVSAFYFLSHMPILTAAGMITAGPILEIGAGFGSTLALHGMCGVMNRDILTLESSKTWMSWFSLYKRKWHKFKHVESFIDIPEYHEREWGMAFLDHGILGERGLALSGISHIPVVVAHDTDREDLNYTNENVPPVLDSFKYRYDHQWIGPQTSVLSNTVDVVSIFREFKL